MGNLIEAVSSIFLSRKSNLFQPIVLIAVLLAVAVVASFSISLFFAPQAQALVVRDGYLYTMGRNAYGQLGFGDTVQRTAPTLVPFPDGVSQWSEISVGATYSLALTINGRMFAWGQNTSGQLGLGDTAQRTSPTPVPFPAGVNRWRTVVAGGGFEIAPMQSLALTSDGRLFVWGGNDFGQLGLGDSGVGTNRNTPTFVPFPDGVTEWSSIAAGLRTSFALTPDGRLFAWGSNSFGQLGLGDSGFGTQRLVPTFVPFPTGVTEWSSVAPGESSTFALTPDGRLFAWGGNVSGTLGLGDSGPGTNRLSPTFVPFPTGVTEWSSVSSGFVHTLALTSDGRLFATGGGFDGQLGLGDTTATNTLTPIPFPDGVTEWSSAAIGQSSSYATTPDGRLFAWGKNWFGQLGLGDSGSGTNRNTPTLVPLPDGAIAWNAIATGGRGFHAGATVRRPSIADLEKRLRLFEDVDIPQVDFTFTITAEAFYVAGVAGNINYVPPIPNRTITINSTSPSTVAAGIRTVTGSINILEGIDFARRGEFYYILEEIPNVPATPNMIYSSARYRLGVYVNHNLEVFAITVSRLNETDGTPVSPAKKVDYLAIYNTFRATTTGTASCPGALVIGKEISEDSPFADTSTLFDFDITLTATVLCPANTSFTGRVQVRNAAGNWVNASPARTYTLNNSASTLVQLRHDERIVFEELVIGTRFTATEREHVDFMASVVLYVNGVRVNVAPNTTKNTELSLGGPHAIGQHLRNSAMFINYQDFSPPTGLVLAAPTYVVAPLFIAGIACVAAFARKARKRIEDMPVMH